MAGTRKKKELHTLTSAAYPDPVKLLIFGEPYPGWYAHNVTEERFFVLNLGLLIERLKITPTTATPYFDGVKDLIARRRQWLVQYGARTKLSPTHIYRKRANGQDKPKKFGEALTIIAAMEIAAARRSSLGINVYDYLRIIPAYYFADKFDVEQLKKLHEFHKGMPEPDRIAKFGAENKDQNFTNICLREIRQLGKTGSLLEELSKGHCATKLVCERLVSFVNDHYPAELHIGPVRTVGEDSYSYLGTKSTAPSLSIPAARDPLDASVGPLPGCF